MILKRSIAEKRPDPYLSVTNHRVGMFRFEVFVQDGGHDNKGLCGDFDVIHGRVWLWNRLTHLAHGFEMRHQRFPKIPPRFFLGVASRDAPGDIR